MNIFYFQQTSRVLRFLDHLKKQNSSIICLFYIILLLNYNKIMINFRMSCLNFYLWLFFINIMVYFTKFHRKNIFCIVIRKIWKCVKIHNLKYTFVYKNLNFIIPILVICLGMNLSNLQEVVRERGAWHGSNWTIHMLTVHHKSLNGVFNNFKFFKFQVIEFILMIVKTVVSGYYWDIHYITFWHWKFKNIVPTVLTFKKNNIHFEAALFFYFGHNHSTPSPYLLVYGGNYNESPEMNLSDRTLLKVQRVFQT